MDLFELLILAAFVLLPMIAEARKGSRKRPPGPPPGGQRSGPDGSADDAGPAPGRERESAAEMLPEDLWAVLTGQRPAGPTGDAPAEPEPVDAPWSVDSADEPDPRLEPAPWETGEPWAVSEPELPEVVGEGAESLEYMGPEAYSLEELDHPAVSLEQPLPSPEVRHAAFHARVDRPAPRARPRRRRVTKALADPVSVRQAFILAEILGPPRGLD